MRIASKINTLKNLLLFDVENKMQYIEYVCEQTCSSSCVYISFTICTFVAVIESISSSQNMSLQYFFF